MAASQGLHEQEVGVGSWRESLDASILAVGCKCSNLHPKCPAQQPPKKDFCVSPHPSHLLLWAALAVYLVLWFPAQHNTWLGGFVFLFVPEDISKEGERRIPVHLHIANTILFLEASISLSFCCYDFIHFYLLERQNERESDNL